MLKQITPFVRLVLASLLISAVHLYSICSVTVADEPADESQLQNDQLAVVGRYARFERLLSQMADVIAREDPERAELLRRAFSKGREAGVSSSMENVARLLRGNNLGEAIERQQQIADDLMILLDLLQSDDRRDAMERERERLNQVLADMQNVFNRQKSARAAAQNAVSPSNAAGEQQDALEAAGRLSEKIRSHDSRQDSSDGQSEGQDTDSEGSDSESGRSEPNADASEPGQSTESGENREGGSEQSPNEGEAGKRPPEGNSEQENQPEDPSGESAGDPSGGPDQESPEGSRPEGAQSDSQQQSGSQQQESGSQQQSGEQSGTPGAQQLEEAQRYMMEALEQLREQQRNQAVEQQDKALEELLDAINELEEKLRQLREEEKEMLLASLEARFQRMLTVQTALLQSTTDLAAVPKDEWLDRTFGHCRETAREQSDLAEECSRTVGLLEEDGTSVSILLAVTDIRTDMELAAGNLGKQRVDSLTQSIQEDIIEGLKELIEATQREQQEMKEQQSGQQSPQGPMEKPPLVDLLAEIRVLRSLQVRVNSRTRRIDGLLAESPDDPDLSVQLKELTHRQRRLIESARTLAEQLEQRR